ncbi:hypothetical protein ACQY1Q_07915 [Tenacibaculum sp. TC6]|uniref:hypothetical protein n=1 Tax=Tenacibaculum sp. TC6 TaxID=3423223 RepID=UPI003D35A6BB
MIKKALYLIASIIAIIFTVGYFRYNPTVNYANKIPVSADKIIRINLRELEFCAIKSFIKHPFSFFENTNTSRSKEKKLTLLNCVTIPSDVFFFSCPGNLKNTWISSRVQIKNKQKLEQFFNQQQALKNQYKNNTYYTHNNSTYLVQENELIVLLSKDKVAVEAVLNSVVNTEEFLPESHNLIKELKKEDAVLTAVTKKEGSIQLYIEDRKLKADGTLGEYEELFLSYNAISTSNAIINVSGKLNPHKTIALLDKQQQDKLKKLTTLSLDSLANFWNGEVNITVASLEKKQDTIITYEYDDDFNKIEKKQLQTSSIPVSATMLKGERMYDYLLEKEVVKQVEEEMILTINPFFKTTVKKIPDGIVLHSGNYKESSILKREMNEVKFKATVDVEKLQQVYTFKNKFLTSLKKGIVSIKSDNKFSAEIEFKNNSKGVAFELLSLVN